MTTMTDDRRYNIRMGISLAIFGTILLWIFLPPGIFYGNRGAANKTACLSNMKQIGTGVGIYVEENEDAFPVARVDGAPSAFGWAARLEPYLKRDDSPWPPIFTDPAERGAAMSYAMNANLAALPRVAEHADATRSVMLFEVGGVPRVRDGDPVAALRRAPAGDGTLRGMIDSFDRTVSATMPATGILANSGLPTTAVSRHGETANYLFLDGHARACLPVEISAGANAAKSGTGGTTKAPRRPDLPGVDLASAAPVGDRSGRGTFSLR